MCYQKTLYPCFSVSLSKLESNPKSMISLYFSIGYLENLIHSSKNLMKVNRSEISSGSFDTSLFDMMKLIVDLINEDMYTLSNNNKKVPKKDSLLLGLN